MGFSRKWYKALAVTLTGTPTEDSQVLPDGTKAVRITNSLKTGGNIQVSTVAGGPYSSVSIYAPLEFEIDSDVTTLYLIGAVPSEVAEILCYKE